jgi:hypothetical protein
MWPKANHTTHNQVRDDVTDKINWSLRARTDLLVTESDPEKRALEISFYAQKKAAKYNAVSKLYASLLPIMTLAIALFLAIWHQLVYVNEGKNPAEVDYPFNYLLVFIVFGMATVYLKSRADLLESFYEDRNLLFQRVAELIKEKA